MRRVCDPNEDLPLRVRKFLKALAKVNTQAATAFVDCYEESPGVWDVRLMYGACAFCNSFVEAKEADSVAWTGTATEKSARDVIVAPYTCEVCAERLANNGAALPS
jgi:hypothetical protein